MYEGSCVPWGLDCKLREGGGGMITCGGISCGAGWAGWAGGRAGTAGGTLANRLMRSCRFGKSDQLT